MTRLVERDTQFGRTLVPIPSAEFNLLTLELDHLPLHRPHEGGVLHYNGLKVFHHHPLR